MIHRPFHQAPTADHRAGRKRDWDISEDEAVVPKRSVLLRQIHIAQSPLSIDLENLLDSDIERKVLHLEPLDHLSRRRARSLSPTSRTPLAGRSRVGPLEVFPGESFKRYDWNTMAYIFPLTWYTPQQLNKVAMQHTIFLALRRQPIL